jgi:putative membrane protein
VSRRDPSPALAAATVLLQIGYPLVRGDARDALTIVTVVVFFLASTTHALVHRGATWTAGYVAVTAVGGLVAEAVGTATGFPFGQYDYADSLGPRLLDVPVVVPLAWAMFAYPCLVVGQRLARSALGAAAVGGLALAAWDLFLDPQMVEAGHWRFTDVTATLPGAPGIPVSNYLGWLLVAWLMLGAAAAAGSPPRGTGPRRPGARRAVPVDLGVVGPRQRRLLRPAARRAHRRGRHGPGRGAVRAVPRVDVLGRPRSA